jgi:hypothetical protein
VWDTPINGDFTLIDQNLGAVIVVALTNANVVLNASQYACGTIRLTGTLSADVTLTFPAVSGWWLVDNQTTGNFVVQLICTSGNRIGLPQAVSSDIFTDGTGVGFRNLPEVGSYKDYASTAAARWLSFCTVPPWLVCNGAPFSGSTYPILAQVLGGTTLPDFRGTSPYYLNAGTGRLTSAGSGLDGDTLFATKFTQTATLITANLPPYTPTGAVNLNTGASGTANATTNNFGGLGGGGTTLVVPGSGLGLSISTNASYTFAGNAQGGTSTPFGVVGTGTIAGVRMIRAG